MPGTTRGEFYELAALLRSRVSAGCMVVTNWNRPYGSGLWRTCGQGRMRVRGGDGRELWDERFSPEFERSHTGRDWRERWVMDVLRQVESKAHPWCPDHGVAWALHPATDDRPDRMRCDRCLEDFVARVFRGDLDHGIEEVGRRAREAQWRAYEARGWYETQPTEQNRRIAEGEYGWARRAYYELCALQDHKRRKEGAK